MLLYVRPATAADIAAIAEVHVRCWQEPYAGLLPPSYLDALSVEARQAVWTAIHRPTDWPASGVFVLVDEDTPVGFAHVCPSRDHDASASVGELTSIYVRRASWGRGGGRLLMTAVLATFEDAGFTAATLWVLAGNERARHFYEVGGWQWDGTEKHSSIAGQPVVELRYRRPVSHPDTT